MLQGLWQERASSTAEPEVEWGDRTVDRIAIEAKNGFRGGEGDNMVKPLRKRERVE